MKTTLIIILFIISSTSYSQGKIVFADTTAQIDSLGIKKQYPNPFSPVPEEEFFLPYNSDVMLEVYNESGKLVNTIYHDKLQKGHYKILWDFKDSSGNKLQSGIYWIKLTSKLKYFETEIITESHYSRLILF